MYVSLVDWEVVIARPLGGSIGGQAPSGVHAISQQSDEYDGDDMCLFFPVLTVSSRPLYPCYTGKRCPCNIYRLVARASDAYLLI